jgi:hypothetical protein
VLRLHGLHTWLHGAQQDWEIASGTDGRSEGRIKVRMSCRRARSTFWALSQQIALAASLAVR